MKNKNCVMVMVEKLEGLLNLIFSSDENKLWLKSLMNHIMFVLERLYYTRFIWILSFSSFRYLCVVHVLSFFMFPAHKHWLVTKC